MTKSGGPIAKGDLFVNPMGPINVVSCRVAVKWCGYISMISICKFWKCATSIANAWLDTIGFWKRYTSVLMGVLDCQLAVNTQQKKQTKWLPWENFESRCQSPTSSGPASRSLLWPADQNMFRCAASPSKLKLIRSIFKYFNFVNWLALNN